MKSTLFQIILTCLKLISIKYTSQSSVAQNIPSSFHWPQQILDQPLHSYLLVYKEEEPNIWESRFFMTDCSLGLILYSLTEVT